MSTSMGPLVESGPAKALLEDTAREVPAVKSTCPLADGERRMDCSRRRGQAAFPKSLVAQGRMDADTNNPNFHVPAR